MDRRARGGLLMESGGGAGECRQRKGGTTGVCG